MTNRHASPLRTARQSAGLTQAEMATVIGISERTLIRWEMEADPSKLPYDGLSRMADKCNCSVPELVGRKPPEGYCCKKGAAS